MESGVVSPRGGALPRTLVGICFLQALISLMLGLVAGVASAAEQGKLAVVVMDGTASRPGGTFSVKTIDPSGNPIATLVSRPAIAIAPTGPFIAASGGSVSWSPDGSTIALYQLNAEANTTSFQLNPSTSGIFLLPGGQLLPWEPAPSVTYRGPLNENSMPAWSPTGEEIAYWAYSYPQGWVLSAIHPDGSGMRPVAPGAPNPVGASQPAWSPDGKTIAFSSAPGPDQGGQLLKVPATGGTVSYLALPEYDGSVVGQPAYSPDGKSIAFIRQLFTGSTFRRLVVRDLATGAERTVTNTYASQAPTKVSWSPDGKRIAYIENSPLPAPGCGVGASGPDCDLVTINADGTDKKVILHADYIQGMAWSGPSDLKVTIDTPTADQEITGHESTPAEKDAVRLTGSVSPPTELSGWCFKVQAPNEPEPAPTSKADCNRPFDSTSPNGETGRFSADLPHPGKDLPVGDDTVWVWAYGSGPKPGVAKVTVKVRPNYFIKDVEVAQAISPVRLGPLPAVDDPLAEGAREIPWSLPSASHYEIPLVAGKRTLLRIYVGDSQLGTDESEKTKLGYTVTGGGLPAPFKGETDSLMSVTAPDRDPKQTDADAAIHVWLPAEAAASGTASFHVEVGPAEQGLPECTGCSPNGNEAELTGVQFEQGGGLNLLPVDVQFLDLHEFKLHRPSPAYAAALGAMLPLLPIRDGGLNIQPSQGTVTIIPLGPFVSCAAVVIEVELFQLMHEPPKQLPAGVTRWVGLASPPPGVDVDCLGATGADEWTNKSMVLFRSGSSVNPLGASTGLHELGHTLGLWHTEGLGSSQAPDAFPLPYTGIGGVGYDADRPGEVFDETSYSDFMSYSHPRWTSPKSWQWMFNEILARSGGPLAVPSVAHPASPPLLPRMRTATPQAPAKSRLARRRLVSGLIFDRRSYIYNSLVADARAPGASGPIVARLVGLDRRGNRVAAIPIHGASHVGHEARPFVVCLPASDRIVTVKLRSPGGGRVFDRLKASKYAPRGRFIRLRRRARADKTLKVRWRATDGDDNSLRVTLLARRRGSWRPITVGPAAFHERVEPWTLGRGKKLRLRLLVSDGFNTTTVKAKPVKLRCTPRLTTGGVAVPSIAAPSAPDLLPDRSSC
jgi:hypothetical protein